MKDELKTSKIGWDWKSSPDLDDLQDALGVFGIVVTEDPDYEGTDAYGFVFSNRELSDDELTELSDCYGYE